MKIKNHKQDFDGIITWSMSSAKKTLPVHKKISTKKLQAWEQYVWIKLSDNVMSSTYLTMVNTQEHGRNPKRI